MAINHNPDKFLIENNIRGLKRISLGLASILVRTGSRYFDFRSTADLIEKADQLVGESHNPFRSINRKDRAYLDTLSAIRNYVVHQSDSALSSYRRYLETVYDIKYKPGPYEFLHAKDLRKGSLERYKPRLYGLVVAVKRAINQT